VIAIFRGAGANSFRAAFERMAGANVRADGQKSGGKAASSRRTPKKWGSF
jgi:hypothetical protein